MNIDRIRLFILSAKHLNITEAARHLHINQSAASRQLKQLQEDLRIKLLRKHGRGIELTKNGRGFLTEVTPICAQFDALRARYARAQESLSIAASHNSSTCLLPSLMAKFSETYPALKLTLHSGANAEVGELLLASKIDLAIITNPKISSSIVNLEPWRREPLTAFVRSTHPLAEKNSITISASDQVRFVIRIRKEGQSSAERALGGLAAQGAKFKMLMGCESSDSVKEVVRHGAAVGILYHDALRREIEQGEFKTLRFPGLETSRQSYIVYSKERPLSVYAREFLALLRGLVPEDSPLKAIPPQVSTRTVSRQTGNPILRSRLLY